MRFSKSIVSLIVFLILPMSAHSKNWYESEKRKCDHLSFSTAVPTIFPMMKNDVGGYYFSVPASSLNQIRSSQYLTEALASPLTSSQATPIRNAVQSAIDASKDAATAIGIATEFKDMIPGAKYLPGSVIGWLLTDANGKQEKLERLVATITVGGQTGHLLGFRSAPDKFQPLMLAMSFYQVQIGAEPKPRRWIFSACLLPVELVISEAETKDPGPHANNKRIIRQTDGTFRRWDITDSKYDNITLLYIEQDEVWAYFIDSTDSNAIWRIHLYGGAMEKRSAPSITWSTLYKSVELK